MRRASLLLTLLLPLALAAGDFKRLYRVRPGEKLTALRELPGEGLVVESRGADGAAITRVLMPAQALAYRLPAGAVPVVATREAGIFFRLGGMVYRKLGATVETVATAPDLPAACPVGPRCTGKCFTEEKDGSVALRGAGSSEVIRLESPGPATALLGHDALDGRFGWVFAQEKGEILLAPSRRKLRVYSAQSGKRLAELKLDSDAPAEAQPAWWLPDCERAAVAAIVHSGRIDWWSESAKNLDEIGEIVVVVN